MPRTVDPRARPSHHDLRLSLPLQTYQFPDKLQGQATTWRGRYWRASGTWAAASAPRRRKGVEHAELSSVHRRAHDHPIPIRQDALLESFRSGGLTRGRVVVHEPDGNDIVDDGRIHRVERVVEPERHLNRIARVGCSPLGSVDHVCPTKGLPEGVDTGIASSRLHWVTGRACCGATRRLADSDSRDQGRRQHEVRVGDGREGNEGDTVAEDGRPFLNDLEGDPGLAHTAWAGQGDEANVDSA